MTRRIPWVAGGLAALLALAAWWPVTTRRGINGVVTVTRIPLWVKSAEFLIRDHHYRRIAREVTAGASDEQDTVMRLFGWVRREIRPQPEDVPVIDDHVYSIIVRGYGTADQFADVLATLCVYAGVPAVVNRLGQGGDRVHFVLAKVRGRWSPLDPYRGAHFESPDGALAAVEDLANDPALLGAAYRGPADPPLDYRRYFYPGLSASHVSVRPYNHLPLHRLWQELTGR